MAQPGVLPMLNANTNYQPPQMFGRGVRDMSSAYAAPQANGNFSGFTPGFAGGNNMPGFSLPNIGMPQMPQIGATGGQAGANYTQGIQAAGLPVNDAMAHTASTALAPIVSDPNQGIFGSMFEGAGNAMGGFKDFLSDMMPSTDFLEGAFGKDGWGSSMFNIGTGIFEGMNALKQLDIQEDMFDLQKDSFNKNYVAQARTTNRAIDDQQRARIGGTGNNNADNTYASVADNRKQYGISEATV